MTKRERTYLQRKKGSIHAVYTSPIIEKIMPILDDYMRANIAIQILTRQKIFYPEEQALLIQKIEAAELQLKELLPESAYTKE